MLAAALLLMSMSMPMMYVGKVRMLVHHQFMDVRMGVRLTRINAGPVLMLVMLIVTVVMRVFQEFVRMLVFVFFGQMQPHAACHVRGSRQRRGHPHVEHQQSPARRNFKMDAGKGRDIRLLTRGVERNDDGLW